MSHPQSFDERFNPDDLSHWLDESPSIFILACNSELRQSLFSVELLIDSIRRDIDSDSTLEKLHLDEGTEIPPNDSFELILEWVSRMKQVVHVAHNYAVHIQQSNPPPKV